MPDDHNIFRCQADSLEQMPELQCSGGVRVLLGSCPVGWLFIFQFPGRDPLRSAPIRLSNVVLNICGPDAPDTPAPNLDSAKFPCPKESPDLVRVHVQLFRRLLNGQETAGFCGVFGQRIILRAAPFHNPLKRG